MSATNAQSVAAVGASAAPASATLARDVQQRVRIEQIRSLYQQAPKTTAGSLVVGTVLLLVMWNAVSHSVLLGWMLTMCVHQAIRVVHYFRYRRASAAEQADPKWGRWYAIAAAIAGCLWGSAGALMFVPDSIVHQAVLLLILSGNVTVSMIVLSAYVPAFFSFTVLSLTPFIVTALVYSGGTQVAVAAYACLVLIMALVFGRSMNKMIAESLAKRFENIDLVEALTVRSKQLSEQTERANRARREAELANASRSKFFRAANHDLRQPVHALGLFGHALRQRIHTPDEQAMVDGMNTSIRSLEKLFNELLDFSKLDAGAIEPALQDFSLQDLMTRLREDNRPEAEAKQLKLRVVPSNTVVRSDPILLERILRNLISNAIRYTAQGSVLVGCRRRGQRVRIEVRDTGIGIAKADQSRIFDEFYQAGSPNRRTKQGLGLGLSTVRGLAALLGHELSLKSAPGKGSVFSIELPRGELPLVEEAPARRDTPPDGVAGKVIVVIDDEAVILKAMRAMLSGWGCAVVTASSAEGALDALGELSRYPDLIIADYRLEGGATGIAAIERLRDEIGLAIPAIIVTASTTTEPVAVAETRGYPLLSKPVLPEQLQRLMVDMLLAPAVQE